MKQELTLKNNLFINTQHSDPELEEQGGMATRRSNSQGSFRGRNLFRLK